MLPLPRLRAATATDAPEIVALLAAVALEGTLGLDPSTLRADEEAARLARLDLRTACALVVVSAGHIRGFAVAVRGAETAVVHTASVSVAVAANSRRRGFGQLLLGGVLAWARAARVHKLCAGVVERNAPALALFHRAGYAVEGVRRHQVTVAGALSDEVLFGLLVEPAAVAATARGRAKARRGGRRGR